MTSPGFQYTPLDKTKSQTRLLEIIPQPDSSLQYSLTTFDLATIPPYIALSYTWGNDEPSHTIVVDGQAFKVRDNLSCALPCLANLRRTGDQSQFRRDERYFWIDAICINQQDTKERNHQVAMMKDIFTTASLTVAWLGPENEDFQVLNTVDLQDRCRKRLWHPIKSLFENIACKEYFTRMWIIQEILLSRELWVMCGNEICTWQTLEEYWIHCFDIRDKIPVWIGWDVLLFIDRISKDNRNTMRALHSVMASRVLRNRHTFYLEDLVHLYHDRKCKDPLDRIYALLGLLPSQALLSSPIPVDYDISPEDLFKLARRHCYVHKHIVHPGSGNRGIYQARSLQMALGIETSFRLQYESELIREGFFRNHKRS